MDKPPLGNKILAIAASAALWPTAVSAQSIISFGFGQNQLSTTSGGLGQGPVVGLIRFILGIIFVFFFVQLIFGLFMEQTHGDNEEAKEKARETLKSAISGMVVSLLLIVLAGSLIGVAYAAAARLNSPLF